MTSHRHHPHQRSAGLVVGAFWLGVTAVGLVLAAGPGHDAGFWSFRVGFFFLQWGAYQGVFAACFSGGVLVDDRRKVVLRWALPAVLAGLCAAAGGFLRLGFPGV